MAVKTSVHEEQRVEDAQPRRHCSYCGEHSGSISKGTGRPLLLDRETGRWEHVNCRPAVGVTALERMGA